MGRNEQLDCCIVVAVEVRWCLTPHTVLWNQDEYRNTIYFNNVGYVNVTISHNKIPLGIIDVTFAHSFYFTVDLVDNRLTANRIKLRLGGLNGETFYITECRAEGCAGCQWRDPVYVFGVSNCISKHKTAV